jgi:DNA polymerase-3 subunit epsilon
MDFIAVDVETANPNLASICQVGIVVFQNGKVKDSWQSLVNPQDYFDGLNVSIHGIDERTVKCAPTFPKISEIVKQYLKGQVVASHTFFDRTAITRVFEKYNLEIFDCTWLDTAKVVRRAWPEFSQRGYGLKNVAEKLGIEFAHHDAKEDARAAGEILVHAIQQTKLNIKDWLEQIKRPIGSSSINIEGNPEGPLYREVAVFTGALSIPRREAAQLAADAGCNVDTSVNTKTTLLIVGDQDIRRLAGHEKSTKHRRAEQLMAEGQHIRILGESDFQRMIELTT